MSEIKLLSCPFCGSELRRNMSNLYEHDKTGCILDGFEFSEENTEKWNDRKPVERVLERLELCSVSEPLTENGIKVGTVKVLPLSAAVQIVKEGLM